MRSLDISYTMCLSGLVPLFARQLTDGAETHMVDSLGKASHDLLGALSKLNVIQEREGNS